MAVLGIEYDQGVMRAGLSKQLVRSYNITFVLLDSLTEMRGMMRCRGQLVQGELTKADRGDSYVSAFNQKQVEVETELHE